MQEIKQNNFIVTAFILSLVMILSVSIFSAITFYSSVQILIFAVVLINTIFVINNYKFKLNGLYVSSLLFLIAISIISYFNCDFQTNSRDNLFILLSSVLAGFSFIFINNDMKKKVLFVPVFIALFLSMILFSKFITDPQSFFQNTNLLETIGINKNFVSGFLILIYPILYIYLKEKKNNKLVVFMTIVVFLSILLTKSKFEILIGSISTFILLYEYRKQKNIKAILICLVIVLIAYLCYLFSLKTDSFSINERMAYWKTSFSIFKDNILFGCGFGNFSTLFNTYRPEYIQYSVNANSFFLQILAELGILGILGFACLIFSFYIRVIDAIIDNKNVYFYIVVTISITSFLFANIVDCSALSPTNMIVFFIILSSVFEPEVQKLKKGRINTYVLILLFIVLLFFLVRPVIAKTYYNKGIDLYIAKQYKMAMEEFEKSIKLDKKNPKYYEQAAKTQFALYDQYRSEIGQIYIDKAIEYNKRAIELCKYNSSFRLELASYYWNNDKKEEAVDVMQEALKYDKFNQEYKEYLFELKNS